MTKSASGSQLPHLTPEELDDRDLEESRLTQRLRDCEDHDGFDSERAMHVLHNSAIEIYKILDSAFFKRPHYSHEWKDEIISSAVFRVLYASFSYVRQYANQEYKGRNDPIADVSEELKEAIREHLKTTNILKPIFMPPALRPRAIGVFAPSKPSPRKSVSSSGAAHKTLEYIDAHGLTRQEFASRAKINVRTLRRFLTEKSVDRSTIQSIASAMDVTAESLLKATGLLNKVIL